MEPLEITLATLLIGKIIDEIAAMYGGDKYPKLKKYIGILSWITKLYTRRK